MSNQNVPDVRIVSRNMHGVKLSRHEADQKDSIVRSTQALQTREPKPKVVMSQIIPRPTGIKADAEKSGAGLSEAHESVAEDEAEEPGSDLIMAAEQTHKATCQDKQQEATADYSSLELPNMTLLDISNAAYHGESTALSSSLLKPALISGEHFVLNLNQEGKATKAKSFGTAVHCVTLESQRFNEEYILKPEFNLRTNAGKEKSKAFDLAHSGKFYLTEQDMRALEQIIQNVSKHKTASKLLSSGQKEKSLFWEDPATGLRLKIRPDNQILQHALLLDVKTTRDIRPEAFERECKKYNYGLSAAMQIDGINHCFGIKCQFAFLVIESVEPYSVAVYTAPEAMIEEGMADYMQAKEQVAMWKKNNHYPPIQNGTGWQELPWRQKRR